MGYKTAYASTYVCTCKRKTEKKRREDVNAKMRTTIDGHIPYRLLSLGACGAYVKILKLWRVGIFVQVFQFRWLLEADFCSPISVCPYTTTTLPFLVYTYWVRQLTACTVCLLWIQYTRVCIYARDKMPKHLPELGVRSTTIVHML